MHHDDQRGCRRAETTLARSRSEARPNLFVGTVHSFALSAIVGPFARAAGLPQLAAARLASDQEVDAAFRRSFDEVLGAGANPVGVKSTVDKIRRLSDYSGDRLLGGPDLADLARRYEAELESIGAYDFNDLMRHAVAMLRDHEWLRRVLISTYPQLYIDEYQDLPQRLTNWCAPCVLTKRSTPRYLRSATRTKLFTALWGPDPSCFET